MFWLAVTGPAILAVSKGPQSQSRYCWWYRSNFSTDFDISDIAGPVLGLLTSWVSIVFIMLGLEASRLEGVQKSAQQRWSCSEVGYTVQSSNHGPKVLHLILDLDSILSKF